ncbi:MAG: hypothetical protein ABI416_07735 [Ginsengibacter sp.]
MNSRSRKYHETRKAEKSIPKNTHSKQGIAGSNKKLPKLPENLPPPTPQPAQPTVQKSAATQDDTGGGNDTGKRSDDN